MDLGGEIQVNVKNFDLSFSSQMVGQHVFL
jgi:hypothetical protein